MSDEEVANRLIRLARGAHGPPDGAKARILARIRSGAPPGSPPPDSPPPEGGPSENGPGEGESGALTQSGSSQSGPRDRRPQTDEGAGTPATGNRSSAPSGRGRLVTGAVAVALVALLGFLSIRSPDPTPSNPRTPDESGVRSPSPSARPIERPEPRPQAPPSSTDRPGDRSLGTSTPPPIDRPVEPLRAPDRAARIPHASEAEVEQTSTDPATEPSTEEPAPPIDELALLARAQRELRGRAPTATLASVAAHREQFPASVFAVERDTLEALANCELGRVEQARRIGGPVLRDHLSTPSAQRLRDSCVGESEPEDP